MTDNKKMQLGMSIWAGLKNVLVLLVAAGLLLNYGAEQHEHRLEEEAKTFGDLIQIRGLDSYENLTYKSVAALWWVKTRAPHTKFLFKIAEVCERERKNAQG